MNHIYTAETPEQLLEHINAGAKAYKSYTEQELIELPPDMIWQKFFLKDFDIPAEKLAGLGEELCYMFDRYRKHIVKREGAEGNAGGSQAARISAGCNLQHYEHDLRTAYSKGTRRRSVFRNAHHEQRLRHPQTAAGDFRDRAERNENRGKNRRLTSEIPSPAMCAACGTPDGR